MIQWSQKAGTDGAAAPLIPNVAPNGGSVSVYAFCPTARDLTVATGTSNVIGVISDDATRTASKVYQVGLKETIRLTATAPSYAWRRICFTSKGLLPVIQNNTPISLLTTGGWTRYTKELTSGGTGQAAALNILRNVIFKGNLGSDWNNYMTAPLDNSRITVKYDKLTVIKSRGDNEINFQTSRWHGMYKNFIYDDDENGGAESYSVNHSVGKAGMGDYIILDFFEPGPYASGSSGTTAKFDIESTMYWHER